MIVATACQAPPSKSLPSETTTAAEQPEPSAEASQASPPAAEPPSPALRPPKLLSGFVGTGALWLGFADRAVRYDTSGFATLPAPGGELLELFEGPDGKPYLRTADAVYRLDADAPIELLRFDDAIRSVHQLALARDLSAWVLSDAGIGKLGAQPKTFTPLAELELDANARLAFDHEGTLWAVAERQALYLDDKRWIPTQVSLLGDNLHFGRTLSSAVGRVHVTNHHLMTRLGKGDYDSIVMDHKLALDYSADLDIAPDGYACVATSRCDVACANAVPPTSIWRFAYHRYSCKQIEAIAVDADHRVWVASPSHLSLLEPNAPDRKAREIPREQLPELAGVVRDMIVVDDR